MGSLQIIHHINARPIIYFQIDTKLCLCGLILSIPEICICVVYPTSSWQHLKTAHKRQTIKDNHTNATEICGIFRHPLLRLRELSSVEKRDFIREFLRINLANNLPPFTHTNLGSGDDELDSENQF